jgi:hypothetical protein
MPMRHTLPVAILFSMLLPRVAPAQERVAAPAFSAMPATAASRPFLDSAHVFSPIDLAKAGYVEEEYSVAGKANVYDWAADGAISVRSAGAPYTTRILVRRPADASKFTGAVLVELMYTPRRWDWPMMWGYTHDALLQRGDAWVGITMPGAVAGLQKFDPARYKSLSFRNPVATACTAAATPSPSEDGLKWDAISQVGALLKSRADGAPFARGPMPSLYLSVQGGDLTTYMNAMHARMRLDDGRPIYDGYLARAPFTATRINQCAAAPAAGDARQTGHGIDVPVIAVASQGDLANTLAVRRDDRDAAGDRYRLYEVAGAGHIDKAAYSGFPSMADQEAAGNAQGTIEWPFTMACTPPIPLMEPPILTLIYDSAFVNLDEWARKGKAAPRAPRLKASANARAAPTIALDEAGHGIGGVRTPYVDVPIATYTTSSPGPGTCAEMGHVVPFDAARLKQMYGSFDAYASKVNASIARLTGERWLTAADGKRLRSELIDAQRSRWPK